MKKEIQITVPESVMAGNYSNLVMITHASTEFYLDFAQSGPGIVDPVVRSRIILAPESAKSLMLALKDNVEKYERQYGGIRLSENRILLSAGHAEA